MKILVTGASGFLGGALCRQLIAEGYEVRAFVRRNSDLSSLLPQNPNPNPNLELAYGDVTDLDSLIEALSGCHVIFHAAALVEPWLQDPSRFFAVNVGGLKNVLEACKKIESVVKVHQGKVFCTEYEKSKAIADRVAMQAASEGVPIILLYPGVIYGAGKLTSGNIVGRILIERFNGRLPGYIGHGKDKFSFSHVEDVVKGHIAAIHKGRIGERYLLTGENASFKHVFDIASVITNTKRPWLHIPLWLIEIYGWISVFFARITGMLPLISYPIVRVLGHQWAYSCHKARQELGYEPRSLKEGLEEILPWMKSLGLIRY